MRCTIRGKYARIKNGPLTADESRELRMQLKALRARTPHGLKRAITRVLTGSSARSANGLLLSFIAARRPTYRATAQRIQHTLGQLGTDPMDIALKDPVFRRRYNRK